ncbi:MAG: cytochrome c oxidase subunit II [Gemmatimonadota bacterium]|nr:cytochrome c oxidase subunit II [Gemmatimonadota bacterium]
MTFLWNPASRVVRRWAFLLPMLVLLVAACSPDKYAQTTLKPISDFARIGDDIQTTTLYWAFGVFVLVEGALLYAIFRFRGKPNDAEPRQVHGNTLIEIVWTIIPALILAAIAVPTVRGIFETNVIPEGESLTVEVIGHQWWWEFRYPDLNITTANEVNIPVGQTVAFRMLTADVVHSFWPPRFAGKRDVFPNRETRLWFKAEEAGEYPGQCAEFCGIQHARMAFRVQAQTPEEFQNWVSHMQTLGPKPAKAAATPAAVRTASVGANLRAPESPDPRNSARQDAAGRDSGATVSAPMPPQDAAYGAGEKLFRAKGCVGCHALNAVDAPKGLIGPNLANIGGRSYIGAGSFKNTDENLARWIRDPQGMKVGVLMPNLGVTAEEARSLVAYLRAHQ